VARYREPGAYAGAAGAYRVERQARRTAASAKESAPAAMRRGESQKLLR
jgi:hypothetical protein